MGNGLAGKIARYGGDIGTVSQRDALTQMSPAQQYNRGVAD
jgi:hypothetical protein